jgi:hypothetical protein
MIYKGGGYLAGVPARDLTIEEAEKHGVEKLLASGLYVLREQSRKKSKRLEAADAVMEGDSNGTGY